MLGKDKICTMESSTNIVRIPKNYGRGWKWPKLEELTGFLFYNNYDVQIPGVHDAEMDSLLTAKCFFKLKEEYQITIRKGQKNFISNNSDPKLPEEIIIPEITQWPRKNEKLSKDPILLKEYNSLRNQFSKSYSKLYNDDGLQNLSGIEREKEEIKLSLTTENLEMFIKDHFDN